MIEFYRYFNLFLVVLCLYCIGNSLILNNTLPTYSLFTKPINFNPNFFAIGIVLGLNSFIHNFSSKNISELNRLGKTIDIFTASVFFISLMLLTSRIAIISFLVVCYILVLYKMFSSSNWKLILLPIILTTTVLALVSLSPIGKTRFVNIISKTKNIRSGFQDKEYSRYHTWHAGWNLIKNRPFKGSDRKKIPSKLNQQYKENNYTYALQQSYHVHNQFLSTAVFGGVFLSIFLICIIWVPVFIIKNSLYFGQSLIITLTFMTDAPLRDFIVFSFFSLICLISIIDLYKISSLK